MSKEKEETSPRTQAQIKSGQKSDRKMQGTPFA